MTLRRDEKPYADERMAWQDQIGRSKSRVVVCAAAFRKAESWSWMSMRIG
jgi:hypothetical protein